VAACSSPGSTGRGSLAEVWAVGCRGVGVSGCRGAARAGWMKIQNEENSGTAFGQAGESQEALAGRIGRADVEDVAVLLINPGGVSGRGSGCTDGRSRGRGRGGDGLVGRPHHVVIDGVAILALVELLAHHVLEIAATEVEDFPEGLAEVAVEGRVDYRIQEAVAVAQPEENAREEGGYGIRVAQKDPYEGEDEEGEPADGESAHYYAQGRARLPLLRQLESESLLLVR
jgi:hypothetical protein